MKRIEKVEQALHSTYAELGRGVSAGELADRLSMHRANVSSDLNKLCIEGRARKGEGRPVLFYPLGTAPGQVAAPASQASVFDDVIGSRGSLVTPIQQAKAAMLYPPFGLHTLILGQTGVGKTMFADLMYRFGKETGRLAIDAPFVSFNCADYAKNPQLLTGQIFGVAKGAFTGADSDQQGLIEKANGGILFLDEVHRLPAEGQEMLFTFIDKGQFRRLGEAGETRTSQVLIISATTEDPKSALLDTFTRRISMVIHLPSLRERTLEERLELINEFFQGESARINREIGVSRNAMLSFLLYECVNNIGQLRSDIQLSCARAFIESASDSHGRVYIFSKIIPEHVRRGSLHLKFHRDEVDRLLGNDSVVVFTPEGGRKSQESGDYVLPEDFYEQIERKVSMLRQKGMSEEEINELVSSDIEGYFRKLGKRNCAPGQGTEVENLLGRHVLELSRSVLDLAVKKLNRPELMDNLFGFAFHISATQERLLKGKSIFNPQLNSVRKQYPQEFSIAIEAARLIEERLLVELPIDEIGYISMFFVSSLAEADPNAVGSVGLLVLMHGSSAASSIANVANTLMNTDIARAFDMPLTMNPEAAYLQVLKEVKQLEQGQGVLMMADMGSLINFGDLITQETGIATRTVPMVSTPMVLEAVRKISLGQDLEQVYNAAMETRLYFGGSEAVAQRKANASRAIVAACFTGHGSSEKVGGYLRDSLNLKRTNTEVVTMGITGREDLCCQIQSLDKQVVAVVGMVDPCMPGIPYFRIEDVLHPQGQQQLQELVERERTYDQVTDTLASHLSVQDSRRLVTLARQVLERIHRGLGREINSDTLIGALLHLGCMVERLVKGKSAQPFPDLDTFVAEHSEACALVERELGVLAEMYGIEISASEVAYILQMVLNS